ncbi:MAG: VCBS repeat-containing protein [Planctomycetes bacterium]|nr:VCBS repeat-containing protein [Planctomycetota bacterium]
MVRSTSCGVAALWWILQGAALGLINPKFTPLHLVKEAEAILALRLEGGAKEGVAMAAVERALKGHLGKKTLEIELAGSSKPEQARLIEKSLRARKGAPALMFVGAWPAKPGEENPAAQPPAARKALVHLDGSWLILVEDERGVWGFDEVSQPMVATWNGSTDMLERAVDYILKDAAADLPVRTGVRWGGHANLGSVRGKVSTVLPVDLRGDGKAALHVASDAGDRLFAFEGKMARDVTEKLGLSARSRAAAWGDFNGDGLADLASWDGQVLRLHSQEKGGGFSATELASLTECLDLATVDAGKAGLIVGTRAAPLLLLFRNGRATVGSPDRASPNSSVFFLRNPRKMARNARSLWVEYV